MSTRFAWPGEAWIKACGLVGGDVLLGAAAEALAVIGNVGEDHAEGVTVYNLEVQDAHTYFVRGQGSAGEPVWVHNAVDYSNVGSYGNVNGHHVIAKASYKDHSDYKTFKGRALAISEAEIRAQGGMHRPDMGILQRRLYDQLAADVVAGVRHNTMRQNTRIAIQVLEEAGNLSATDARTIAYMANRQLRAAGSHPTNIPWN